jgi:MFS family permease
MGTTLSRVAVFAIAGWSGFFVMALELLSGRILAPNFGNSIYVWGGVITVFMLALAVGYFVGGQLSVRAPSLRRLAAILLAVAAATLPVVLFGDGLLDWIFDRVQDPRYGSLISATLLFFVPTAIAGMVAPYSVRLLVLDQQRSGQIAGFLYFISTFGSAAGTILTSFYLVLYLEVDQIIWTLLAISGVLGAVALVGGQRRTADA